MEVAILLVSLFSLRNLSASFRTIEYRLLPPWLDGVPKNAPVQHQIYPSSPERLRNRLGKNLYRHIDCTLFVG